MPENEEKYFPSTGHSFKLRRPTGKKNRIQLNLVHEWPAFINVFSPNYSPLSLSLSHFDLPSVIRTPQLPGFTRKAKKKKRESHSDSHEYVTSVCRPRYFPLFQGERERERGNFIDERLPRCWISMESCDVLKPIAMHLR